MSPSWLGAETKTELPSHGRLGEDPTKFYPTRGRGRTAPIGLPALLPNSARHATGSKLLVSQGRVN
jgi:hypothetical protein